MSFEPLIDLPGGSCGCGCAGSGACAAGQQVGVGFLPADGGGGDWDWGWFDNWWNDVFAPDNFYWDPGYYPPPLMNIPDECGRLLGDPEYGQPCLVAPPPCADNQILSLVTKRVGNEVKDEWDCINKPACPPGTLETAPGSGRCCPQGWLLKNDVCVNPGTNQTQRPGQPSPGNSTRPGGTVSKPNTSTPSGQQMTPQQVCAQYGMTYNAQKRICERSSNSTTPTQSSLQNMLPLLVGGVLLLAVLK